MKKKKTSFTMVELVVSVLIVGILAAFGAPRYLKARERAIAKEAISNIRLITAAEQVYGMEIGGSFFTTSDIDAINSELHLAVSGNNWQYNTNDVGDGTVTVTADRVSGKYENCIYVLNSGSADGNPVPLVPANCP